MTRAQHGFLLLLLSMQCSSLFAQRAALFGSVTDQGDHVVSGASVTLLNLDQGLRRDAASNSDGYFTVPFLQPGHYMVSVQKEGFAISEVRDLVLHVDENRGLNIALKVGVQPVQIQVSAQAQPVEVVSSALGSVVVGEVVRNAPLNGRDVRDLALLQPGVTPTDSDFTTNGVGTFNVAGGRSDSVAYLLDGGSNNDLIDNRAVYVPNPDTVAEFRILTSNYPAEFGRNSGGVVSVATRSGSNQFHGTAFDFLRNDALDANSYFNKVNGVPRDNLKRNQYGGTFGGPIGIPRPGVGKNLMFFFFGYQGERQDQTLTLHSVPTFTPAELSGNFSQAGPNGSPDSNVAAFLLANPFYQADPAKAAQAIIEPARINGVAQNYISAGLIPTSATGVLNPSQPLTLNSNELTGKFDFDVSASDKLSVTLGWDQTHEISPFDYATVKGFPDVSDFHDYVFNGVYTHIFYPNLINEFRLTAERTKNDSENPGRKLPTPAQLGIGVTPDLPNGPANLFFDTGLSVGFSAVGPQKFADNTYTFSDAITWVRGNHALKFGGGFSIYQNNTFFAFINDGQFVFFGTNGIGSQNSFADFLLGIPLQYSQGSAAPSNVRSKFTDSFVQDSWKVRKNLVLDLGLRYEYASPKLDTLGRTFSVIPGLQSQRFPNAPPGMVFPGDRGAPKGVNFPDPNNWAPRIGFAWDPAGNGKTSLRGAAGVFYDILKAEDNLQFNGSPPFYASATLGFSPFTGGTPPNYLGQPFTSAGAENPFPSGTPSPNLNFGAEGYLPIGGSGTTFVVDPHLRTPYTYQYHLTLERELLPNTVVQIGYVGNSSHGLTSLIDINPFIPGTFTRTLNTLPSNGTCGVNTASPYCYGVLDEFKNVANANYNGLIASLQKQLSGTGPFGRSYFTLSYTFAHNIDNASGFENRNRAVPSYDPGLFRASADMDVRHRIVFSGGWELPFDYTFPQVSHKLTRGWNVFPIISWRTGYPLDVSANLPSIFDYTSPGPSGAGDAALVHANLVAPVSTKNPGVVQSLNGASGHFWFDPSSFSNVQCQNGDPTCLPSASVFPSDAQAVANPAARTYGSLPRNYFRGPGRFNINLAFAKSTPLTEKLRLELRADAFNLLNSAEFSNPDTNISSPTFGQVLNTAGPRIIQLSMRFSF